MRCVGSYSDLKMRQEAAKYVFSICRQCLHRFVGGVGVERVETSEIRKACVLYVRYKNIFYSLMLTKVKDRGQEGRMTEIPDKFFHLLHEDAFARLWQMNGTGQTESEH